VIVSHEHGFVFMKTRKTAGTSVEIALSRVCGDNDVITPVTEVDEVLRRAAGGRGPQHFLTPPNLERKAFNHMPVSMVRTMLGRKQFESYFSFAIERNPWDAVVSLFHWRNRDAEPGSAVQSFGEYVASEAVETFAAKNQRIYLRGQVAVDRVLRYENLADELAAVWSELDLPGSPDLPHAKAGVRPRGPSYRSYYDDASRERVAELFAAPIADLGYEF
jgi:hypothetical protein